MQVENDNPEILLPVVQDSEIKTWLVNYVGDKLSPADGDVNVEMIVEVMASEFPELLLPIAEENFVRGYQQAAQDIKQWEVTYENDSHENDLEAQEEE